jgi:hypothetical protein
MVVAIAPSNLVATQSSLVSINPAQETLVTSVDGFQRVVASHLEPNFYN